MKTLSIDIETYSSVDLAKCGVYKYTEASDFDILLFGYSVDGGKVIEYVGIAADEQYRLERANNQNPNHRHPLVDWGWTERDCLRYRDALKR